MRSVFLIFILLTGVSFGQIESPKKDSDAQPAGASEKEQELLDEERSVDEIRMEKAGNKAKKATQSTDRYRVLESSKAESQNSLEQSVQYTSNSAMFKTTKAQVSQQRTQRTPTESRQQQLDDAVEYFEQTAPQSFEYNYYKYAAGNHNTALESNLKQAESLRPENADVHIQYAAFYMISGDAKKATEYIEKLISSGRLSKSSIDYCEDVLLSTPQNGILITHGFDDTYGSYYAQQGLSLRKDVTIVSLDLLQSAQFRNRLKAKGISLSTSDVIDIAYLNQFCTKNKDKGLAISLTTPKEYFKPILKDLYAVGLVFTYVPVKAPDNFSENESLWYNSLNKKVIQSPRDDKAKQLSANYLPMLFQMRKVYHGRGDGVKLKEIDLVLDKIGAQCRKYEQVQGLKNAY